MNKEISNCYRAILAQINQLDSIYQQRIRLKDLYEEIAILAYYIMENDRQNVLYNIEELIEINKELRIGEDNERQAEVESILVEIETHLNYLGVEYRKCG